MAIRGKVVGSEPKTELERPVRIRKYQYLYLIVCEDENTEPEYFRQFKIKIPEETIYLKEVGTGRDARGVVEQAVLERDKLAAFAKKSVDIVWVVFDKDDADENAAKIDRYHHAFELAGQEKFKLAHSNEVFELWLLLHLIDVDPTVPIGRKVIYYYLQKIISSHKDHGNFVYEHGNSNILKIIADIGDEQKAMIRADKLASFHNEKDPILCNPVTFVHQLIKNLYEWIAFYEYEP